MVVCSIIVVTWQQLPVDEVHGNSLYSASGSIAPLEAILVVVISP